MTFFRMLVIFAVAIVLFVSCSSAPEQKVVEVTAKDFKFITQDSIPSGWTTFKFINAGHTVHFFLLDQLPDSITFDMFNNQVAKKFDIIMDSLKAGMSQQDAVGLILDIVPGWYFSDIDQMGGSGMVSQGKSEEITLNLTPGTYVMECYIKEKGVFHTSLGMIRPIVVTEQKSGGKPPLASTQINLTNSGYQLEGVFNRGSNTVAVHFKEQPANGPGNDVQIVKMTDQTSLDSVVAWMNWMNITGMQSPAPAEFFGGSQEMPVGNTSYFTTTLDTGQYILISESAAAKQFVQKFEIK